VSVYLAHRAGMQTLSSRGQVVVSRLPLPLLMVGYTTVGLWILSLPIGAANG